MGNYNSTHTGAQIDNKITNTYTKSEIDNLLNSLAAIEIFDNISIVASNWTGSGPYINVVTVTGLLATDTPIMDLIVSTNYTTVQDEITNYAYIYKAICSDNTLTIYATSAPTVNLNIQLVCVR